MLVFSELIIPRIELYVVVAEAVMRVARDACEGRGRKDISNGSKST